MHQYMFSFVELYRINVSESESALNAYKETLLNIRERMRDGRREKGKKDWKTDALFVESQNIKHNKTRCMPVKDLSRCP